MRYSVSRACPAVPGGDGGAAGVAVGAAGVGGNLSHLSLNFLLTSDPCPLLPKKAPTSHQRSQDPRCPVYTLLAAASGSGTHPASRVSLPSGQGDPRPPASLLLVQAFRAHGGQSHHLGLWGTRPAGAVRADGAGALWCGDRYPSPGSRCE